MTYYGHGRENAQNFIDKIIYANDRNVEWFPKNLCQRCYSSENKKVTFVLPVKLPPMIYITEPIPQVIPITKNCYNETIQVNFWWKNTEFINGDPTSCFHEIDLNQFTLNLFNNKWHS